MSPLGDRVLRLENFEQAFDVDKTNAMKIVDTKAEVKVAKAEVNNDLAAQFALTKGKSNGRTCNVCKVSSQRLMARGSKETRKRWRA